MALASRAWLALGFLLALVDVADAAVETLGSAAWAGVVIATVSVFAWLRDPARAWLLWGYVAPLAAWAWAERILVESGVHHGKILPAAVALALALSGVEAACGVVAATYVLAGVAKLTGAGLNFLDPDYLGTLVLERSFLVPGGLSTLRQFVAESPLACTTLAALTLAAELGAVLFVVRRYRLRVAVVLAAMHVGIWITMGYTYISWVAVLLGLATIVGSEAPRLERLNA